MSDLLIDKVRSIAAGVEALGISTSKANARGVFARAGFTGQGLEIALGVSYAESEGYSDAVGDVSLVNDQWGPSVGLFQVRSLREPLDFGPLDRYRYAWALRDPDYNAVAAYHLSAAGTDWHLWSTYTSGSYKARVGVDYIIRTGHVRAAQWGL